MEEDIILTKVCSKCKEEKPLNEFNKDKHKVDGLTSSCKICNKISSKKYKLENRDIVRESAAIYYREHKEEHYKSQLKWNIENAVYLKEYMKKYGEDNKAKIKEQRKKYREENKEKMNSYRVENYDKIRKQQRDRENIRLLTDKLFKLKHSIKNLIRKSIKSKGSRKNSKTAVILGCTFSEFKIHIENQFTEGMSWDNYGKWHLDHIYPASRAVDEEHLIALNHYTNFQPLWAADNIRKSNKLPEELFNINTSITTLTITEEQ